MLHIAVGLFLLLYRNGGMEMKKSDISFKTYYSFPDEELKKKGTYLEKESNASFMLCWPWIETWLSKVDHQRYVIEGIRDNKTVLLTIVSLVKSISRKNFMHSSRLIFNHTGDMEKDKICTEYNSLLVSREGEKDILNAFWNFILNTELFGKFDEILIPYATEEWKEKLANNPMVYTDIIDMPAYEVNLQKLRETDCKYLSSLSGKNRKQIRISIEEYEKKFDKIILVHASSLKEAQEWFREMETYHLQRWGDSSGFLVPSFKTFHNSLITKYFDSGIIDIIRVTAGNYNIGIIYNFINGDEVLVYLTVFQYLENYKFKPGLTTHALCIQDYLDRGKSVYNFMAGEAQYKASLGEQGKHLYHLRYSKRQFKFFVDNFYSNHLVETYNKTKAIGNVMAMMFPGITF